MPQKDFMLSAKVSSDNLSAVKPALERFIGNKGTVKETAQGFEVEAELHGESAVALNRTLLSEMRRTEKRTRLRAEWTSEGKTEKFFDYVPKGSRNPQVQ